jgi:hypothetical protein
MTISSSGSVSSSGAGGRVVTVNGDTSFSCGRGGPLIAISSIEASGVTFAVDNAPVTVAAGTEATVGPYRIQVIRVDGESAQFDVTPT